MPRFDSLTTSLDAPITPADVEADIAAFGEVVDAALTAPQAIPPGGIPAAVIFDTAVGNSGGEYDFITGAYTAPASGLYRITAQTVAASPTACNVSVQIDAGPGMARTIPGTVDPGAGVNVATLDVVLALNLGQTVTIFFEDVGGAGINVNAPSNATFERIA